MATQTISIMDQVKTYEDACRIKGIEPLTLVQFSFLPEKDRQAMYSLHRITTVIDVLNEEHVFDWNNYDECKYYPWFDMETYGDAPAGSGFSFCDFGCDSTGTHVGARLCLKSRELARYVGQQFQEDYRNWMKQ